MSNDSNMAHYLARCEDIELKEINATWRKSPFFQALPPITMLLPPCGCGIVGDGNLPSPLRIKFCAMHAKAKP